MRRIAKSLLVALASLVYAGIASGHIITAKMTSGGIDPSDTLTVDIMLDTEGVAIYGFALYVSSDMQVLFADTFNSVQHPLPGSEYNYFYPPGDVEEFYIFSFTLAPGGMGPFTDVSIATLVFHVSQPASSTWIIPSFDAGPYGQYVEFDGSQPVDVTGQVVLNVLHVPEPTTTMLMVLGLFGILYASPRRR